MLRMSSIVAAAVIVVAATPSAKAGGEPRKRPCAVVQWTDLHNFANVGLATSEVHSAIEVGYGSVGKPLASPIRYLEFGQIITGTAEDQLHNASCAAVEGTDLYRAAGHFLSMSEVNEIAAKVGTPLEVGYSVIGHRSARTSAHIAPQQAVAVK
jgi:hypothetical protein